MLDALDRVTTRRLRALGRAAQTRGIDAYLVGGCVRDLWLGAAVRDLDVVVTGRGERLMAGLARSLGARVERRSRFGTATIGFDDGARIDLASARTETYPAPAALPRVRRGSLHDDLARRDFGVNAVALDLAPRRFGRVVDPLGGVADLRARRLRVLHDRSFLDDPTRAFRAVRLAARLGLRIAPATGRLIEAARAAGVFERLSASRRHAALVLLLQESRLTATARCASRYHLWETVHAGLRPGEARFAELRRFERFRARHWVTALAILMAGFTEERTAALLVRLRPRRREGRLLRVAVEESGRIIRALSRGGSTRPSALHRCCRDTPAEILLVAAARIAEAPVRRRLVHYAVEGRRVRPDLRGSELIRRGVPPGPRVAAGLDAALGAKLDGRARSKARQLEVALRAAAEA